ncbi:MAG: tetratricopeptide repeat protein [Candidatus Bathyarchaeia archaeon]
MDDESGSAKAKEYPIFVCHEQITGGDFAEYLREGLRKKRLECFAFETDMPRLIKPGAIEWRTIIDGVIATCHSFFLLITSDILSEEVVREFEQAMVRLKKNHGFSIVIFRYKRGVARTSDAILSSLKLDTSRLNQNDFESKEDLVRQALQLVDDKGFGREPTSSPSNSLPGSDARPDRNTVIPSNSPQEIILKRRYREGPLKEEVVRFVGEKAIARYVDGMSKLISVQSGTILGVVQALHLLNENRFDEADITASKAIETIQTVDIKKRKTSLSQLYLIKGDAAFGRSHFFDAEKSYALSHKLALEIRDTFLETASANGIAASKGSRGDTIGALKILTQIPRSDNGSVWLNKGIALTLLGRNDEALQACNTSLTLSRKTGDQSGIAKALHNLGMIEQDRGNYDKARQFYGSSLDIHRKLGDQFGIAATLHQLGMIEQDQCNFDEAKRLYGQALEIERKLDNQYTLSRTLHQLGVTEYLEGNYDEAQRLYNQSIELSRKLGDRSQMAGTLGQLAIIEQHRGNYVEARRIYNDVLNAFKTLEDFRAMAIALNQLGLIEADQGNYNEAVRLHNQALEIDRKFGDQIGTAVTLHHLATIELNKDNYDEAKRLYNDVLNTCKKLGNQSGVSKTLHQLGMIEQNLRNYDNASRLYNQALEIDRKIGDPYGLANSLAQLATVKFDLNNCDEAEQLFNEAMAIFQRLGNQLGIAGTLTGLGRVSEKRGNYDEAKKLYDRSLEIEQKLGNQREIATTLHNLGNVESQKRHYDDAKRLYEASLDISQRLQNHSGMVVTMRQLGSLAETQGDLRTAEIRYSRAFQIVRNTGLKQHEEMIQDDLERIYQRRRYL